MNDPIAIRVTPRDPIIARDGRPFSAGLRARSLDWLYPSVLAGSLRTRLGQLVGKLDKSLLECEVAGGLPVLEGHSSDGDAHIGQLYFPAPADALARSTRGGFEVFAARPTEPWAGCGCDLPPHDGLLPVMLPDVVRDEFKPADVPRFWSTERMEQWLVEPAADSEGRSGLVKPPFKPWPEGFLAGPRKDERMHVKMNPLSGTGEEEMLFQTTGLDIAGLREHACRKEKGAVDTPAWLSVRVRPAQQLREAAEGLDTWGPLGGERRIVHWRRNEPLPAGWECPDVVRRALKSAGGSGPARVGVRMVLATPGLFKRGWLPDWLNGSSGPGAPLEGMPLLSNGKQIDVRLRLCGACVDRWRPISGWSLEAGSFGPKPVRRMVPAGAVYFFQVIEGNAEKLSDAWMESVCDEPQDGSDGFGLALWGVWRPHKQRNEREE